MADHDVYCEALVRESDRDRFLAALFAPARYRPALFALYAFDLEIGRVASLVREPMAGEIRFQWWRDVIAGRGHSGGSPVATALIEAMQSSRMPECELIDFIDAHAAALHPETPSAERDEAHAKADGLIFGLAARILNDGESPAIGRLSQVAGSVLCLVRKPLNGDRGVRGLGRERLSAAQDLLRQTPEKLWPAFLTLALVPPVLAGKSLPQWRRQWILWRAARNLPRALR